MILVFHRISEENDFVFSVMLIMLKNSCITLDGSRTFIFIYSPSFSFLPQVITLQDNSQGLKKKSHTCNIKRVERALSAWILSPSPFPPWEISANLQTEACGFKTSVWTRHHCLSYYQGQPLEYGSVTFGLIQRLFWGAAWLSLWAPHSETVRRAQDLRFTAWKSIHPLR